MRFCLGGGVRRQMFPSRGLRKEIAAEAHILSRKLLPFSLTSSPQQPAVKYPLTLTSSKMHEEAQEEFPQQCLLCLMF